MSIASAIPKEKIIERLNYENPWWKTKKIAPLFDRMRRRLYLELFFPYAKELNVKRAVVLMGPRRVGKTVLLQHSIARLLDEKVQATNLFFVAVDNPIYFSLGLADLLDVYKETMRKKSLDNCYIFFDEIQYLKDWERHLKVIVDNYPNTKFIVSGSAAAALKYYSTESGAGRFTDFKLPPLTFQEFIHLKELDHLMYNTKLKLNGEIVEYKVPRDIKALNQEFMDYINFGGYPEVVLSEKIQGDMGRFIKSDIVDKVLLRDLPSIYGIRTVQELNRFFSFLAYKTGNEFSYENLSKDSGIQKDLLKRYLEYLEAAFLIRILKKVNVNSKRLKRITSFKVYLTNPSLRTALFSQVSPTDNDMGSMVETTLLSQWMHLDQLDLAYASWRDGRKEGEVDLVSMDKLGIKPLWCLEIKWSNRYVEKLGELKSLQSYCQTNKIDEAIVTTIDKTITKQVDGFTYNFLPAAVYAYNAGLQTLKPAKQS